MSGSFTVREVCSGLGFMTVGQLSTRGGIIKVLSIRRKIREKRRSRRSWKKKEAWRDKSASLTSLS
jgi:hypothetical protein